MSINPTTSDPYAYLDRALPNSPVAQYVPAASTAAVDEPNAFGEDGFGFDDFLDIINPLQHIPGVSSIYREITGDQINPGSRLIGGSIFGGGIGLAVSFVNAAIEDSTGKDIGAHFFNIFTPGAEDTPETILAVTPEEAKVQTPPAASTPPVLPAGPLPVIPKTQPAVPKEEEASELPAATPIGLQWKGKKPDFAQNLEQARAVHTQDLTQAQLNTVFRSFQLAKEPAVAAQKATAAYEKAALVQPAVTTSIAATAEPLTNSENYPQTDISR
ncbi:hypothetical protein NBZ79_00415 [Sneathiella marina]|uniref:Uncharacterized protein n=1 Tax=Sneathiella marina TaxID=2950108 RepID=A0ABY4W2P0_9PROT|nr:hypothetical protein [Sneathiella marina]USG61438.1 hypothetical protein NBZ79_00415 [Sneathiella marina]